tara:strand:+ start:639 stop:821 length:183 start_codon:yes stop_codon:yes gene_type:complete
MTGRISTTVRVETMKLNIQTIPTALIAAIVGGGWFWPRVNQEAEGAREAVATLRGGRIGV